MANTASYNQNRESREIIPDSLRGQKKNILRENKEECCVRQRVRVARHLGSTCV